MLLNKNTVNRNLSPIESLVANFLDKKRINYILWINKNWFLKIEIRSFDFMNFLIDDLKKTFSEKYSEDVLIKVYKKNDRTAVLQVWNLIILFEKKILFEVVDITKEKIFKLFKAI